MQSIDFCSKDCIEENVWTPKHIEQCVYGKERRESKNIGQLTNDRDSKSGLLSTWAENILICTETVWNELLFLFLLPKFPGYFSIPSKLPHATLPIGKYPEKKKVASLSEENNNDNYNHNLTRHSLVYNEHRIIYYHIDMAGQGVGRGDSLLYFPSALLRLLFLSHITEIN